MNWLGNLYGWAKTAVRVVTGAITDPGQAIASAAGAAASAISSLGTFIAGPLLTWARNLLVSLSVFHLVDVEYQLVFHRLPSWTWLTQVRPQASALAAQIRALAASVAFRIHVVYIVMGELYQAARAYANELVTAERAERIKAVQAEAAARVHGDKVVLQTVQQQAASGYNTGTAGRLGVIAGMLRSIAEDNAGTEDVVSDVTQGILDLAEVDDPVVRFLLGKAISDVIERLGVDQAAADLIDSLFGAAAGAPRATDLYSAEKDTAARLNTLEQFAATFMASGGGQVEEAGDEWERVSSTESQLAILGFVGLAVTDPAGTAQVIADTLGVVADGLLTGIVDLVNAAEEVT